MMVKMWRGIVKYVSVGKELEDGRNGNEELMDSVQKERKSGGAGGRSYSDNG